MNNKVKIHYVIVNNGDGSASMHFCKNNKLAEIYDIFSQYSEGFGEGEYFEKELEFDEKGEILEEYCVDVKQSLLDVINSEYYVENDPKYVDNCKQWLKEIEEDEK